MSTVKQKLLNAISAHPRLAAFGIGLALTISIGAAMGTFGVHTAYARFHHFGFGFHHPFFG